MVDEVKEVEVAKEEEKDNKLKSVVPATPIADMKSLLELRATDKARKMQEKAKRAGRRVFLSFQRRDNRVEKE